ncbi:hypothetical protein B0H17DRAFT_1331269 [Mycena rosella]|uniref:Uncharacterized protein n=1 Tax=Mycena rosella TaxID=1033263 RepID=A0AAD7DJB4_MYCRO|nr:hypothetical protein B0H17DRAFT_1331269 [Mycena rosella]
MQFLAFPQLTLILAAAFSLSATAASVDARSNVSYPADARIATTYLELAVDRGQDPLPQFALSIRRKREREPTTVPSSIQNEVDAGDNSYGLAAYYAQLLVPARAAMD